MPRRNSPNEAADWILVFSDEQWREILDIRRPRVSEAIARRELVHALTGVWRINNPKAQRARVRRIIKLARGLEAELRAQDTPVLIEETRTGFAKTELKAISEVRRRAEWKLEFLDMWIKSRAKRSDPERRRLLKRLFAVSVDSFGGTLTVTDREGAEPAGDLIRFVQVATRMFRPSFSSHTIRKHALPERAASKGILKHKR